MKRLLMILSTAVLLCGCRQAGNESVPIAEETAPASEPKQQEIVNTPSPEPKSTMEYLNGTWQLETNDPTTDKSVSLVFSSEDNTVRIENTDGEYVIASVSPFDSYPDDPAGTGDALRFEAESASENLIETYGSSMPVYCSDMQWYTGSFRDRDYLFLRELGNGQSVLDGEVLGDSRMAGDYGWVFSRTTDGTVPDPDENESLKLRDGTYYALCWKQDGRSYLLQPVSAYETNENWYGEVLNTIRIKYQDTDNDNVLCLYDGTELPEFVDFGLLEVTVDETGSIKGVQEIRYLGYGAYEGKQTAQ